MSGHLQQDKQAKELMEYPCDFPLKVFGLNHADFEQIVLDLIKPHCPDSTEFLVSRNHSKNGKYLSLTIRFTAQSRQQLDAIYQSLSDSKHVVMSL